MMPQQVLLVCLLVVMMNYNFSVLRLHRSLSRRKAVKRLILIHLLHLTHSSSYLLKVFTLNCVMQEAFPEPGQQPNSIRMLRTRTNQES